MGDKEFGEAQPIGGEMRPSGTGENANPWGSPGTGSHQPLPPAPNSYQAAPGYPPPPVPIYSAPASTERNWMAIVSIVLGFLGGGIIGLMLGVVGLRATREGRATNRTAAIWGIVLNATMWIVWVGIFAGAGLIGSLSNGMAGADSNPSRDEPGSVFAPDDSGDSESQYGVDLPEGYVYVEEVGVGECISVFHESIPGATQIVPCDVPHYGQVYSTGILSLGQFTSDEEIAAKVDELCFSSSATGGIREDMLDILWAESYYPSLASYELGISNYQCIASLSSGLLESSIYPDGQLSAG